MTDQTGSLDDGKHSDYGSDFGSDDESALAVLLSQAVAQPTISVFGHAEQVPLPVSAQGKRRRYVDDEGHIFEMFSRDGPVVEASIEIEYDECNRESFSRKLQSICDWPISPATIQKWWRCIYHSHTATPC